MRPTLHALASISVLAAATPALAQVRIVALDAEGTPPEQPYVGGAYVTHIAEDHSFAAGWSTIMGDGSPAVLMWDLTTGAMVLPPYMSGWPTGISNDGRFMTTTFDWMFVQGALRFDRVTGVPTWFPVERYSESGDGLRRAEAVQLTSTLAETRVYSTTSGALLATVPGLGDINASGNLVITSTHMWQQGVGVIDLRALWPAGARLSDFAWFMSPDGSTFGGQLTLPSYNGFLWRSGEATVTPGVVPMNASRGGHVLLSFHLSDPGVALGSVFASRITTPRHGEQLVGDFLSAEAPAFNPPGGLRLARAVSPDGRGLVVYVAYNPATQVGHEYYYVELAGDYLCGDIDFNNDGLFPDVEDVNTFICDFSGGDCCIGVPPGACDSIDFNHDGQFPDVADIEAFVRVFSGGTCS